MKDISAIHDRATLDSLEKKYIDQRSAEHKIADWNQRSTTYLCTAFMVTSGIGYLGYAGCALSGTNLGLTAAMIETIKHVIVAALGSFMLILSHLVLNQSMANYRARDLTDKISQVIDQDMKLLKENKEYYTGIIKTAVISLAASIALSLGYKHFTS